MVPQRVAEPDHHPADLGLVELEALERVRLHAVPVPLRLPARGAARDVTEAALVAVEAGQDPPAARRASARAIAEPRRPRWMRRRSSGVLDASGGGQQAEPARGADDRLGARDERDVDHPAIHQKRPDLPTRHTHPLE